MDPSHTNLWRLDDVFPVPCPLSPSGSQAEQRPVFDNFFPRVDLSSLQQDGADQLQSLLHERETHGQSEWPYQTNAYSSSSESMFTSGSQAVTGDMRESYDPAGDMNAEGDHEYIDRVAFPDAHEHRLMSSGSSSPAFHNRDYRSSGSATSDTSNLPSFSINIDPTPVPQPEPITSAAGESSDDITVAFLPSCSSTPEGTINKLIASKLFQALVKPATPYGAPAIIEVDSVGSSATHQHNVWKFFCTPKFLDGSRGARQSAFVCNNPLVAECDRVMTDSGSMRNHQTTQGHGKANIICGDCKLVFNTGRDSALKRHKEKACNNRQKKIAKATTDRAKKTRKPKKERKPSV